MLQLKAKRLQVNFKVNFKWWFYLLAMETSDNNRLGNGLEIRTFEGVSDWTELCKCAVLMLALPGRMVVLKVNSLLQVEITRATCLYMSFI